MASRFVHRESLFTAPVPLAVLLPGPIFLVTFGAIVLVAGRRHSHAISGDSRVRGLVSGELVDEIFYGRGFVWWMLKARLLWLCYRRRSNSFGRSRSSTSLIRSSESVSSISFRRSRSSYTSAIKPVGSRPEFIEACKRFARHARPVSLVLPSYRRLHLLSPS